MNTNSGRDSQGKFKKGNKCSCGRPKNSFPERVREAVYGHITPEQVITVLDAMYDLAIEGDVSAARVFLDYVLGKPKQDVAIESGVALTLEDFVKSVDLSYADYVGGGK